jgi:hypothetical protein
MRGILSNSIFDTSSGFGVVVGMKTRREEDDRNAFRSSCVTGAWLNSNQKASFAATLGGSGVSSRCTVAEVWRR